MESGTHLPNLDLTTFFLSISTAALQALGNEKKDLLFAKQNIELLELMFQKTKGNRTRAASILEISHRALLYKIKEYGLTDA